MRIIAIIFIGMTFMAASCKNGGKVQEEDKIITQLYEQYQNGEISRCSFEDKTVYKGALNAYDAGSEIYDDQGVKIGACYYNTGQVDAICEQLNSCEVIWRVGKNIWGKDGVNQIGK